MIRMNRTQIFSDESNRLNFYVDNEAKKLDGLFVELPASGMAGLLVHDMQREGMSFGDLWSEAMAAGESLRSQPYVRVYPPTVFIPFVEVTAVDMSRESAKQQLLFNLGAGSSYIHDVEWGSRRVECLAKAVDAFAALYPHLMPRAVLQ